LSNLDPSVGQRVQAPFRHERVAVPPRVLMLQQRLRKRLRSGLATTLEIEETGLKILHEVARASYVDQPCPPAKHGVATRRRRMEWAEATQGLIAAQPAADLSLHAIARAVGCSPFHLARVFEEEVGVPIHQLQLRLRLALALELLGDGAENLSALALDLGFSTHSHFTACFRRAFGLSPSRFRLGA
jgi:AraC family transcriptional regulator